MTISILLADDHKIFRESLRLLLGQQADFQIVGEAANGVEAVAKAEQLRPGVVILDVAMPDLNGLEALRQIKQRRPETCVVVLSSYNDEGYVVDALSHGAAAYVLKEQSGADLVLAIKAAVAGYRYLSPPLSERALEIYLSIGQRQGAAAPGLSQDTLTKREKQILALTDQGLTNAEIGQKLGVSVRAIETHRAHLMLKLGLRSRTELMQYAQAQKKSWSDK